MEDTLRDEKTVVELRNFLVLILVLMEDTLRGNVAKGWDQAIEGS